LRTLRVSRWMERPLLREMTGNCWISCLQSVYSSICIRHKAQCAADRQTEKNPTEERPADWNAMHHHSLQQHT